MGNNRRDRDVVSDVLGCFFVALLVGLLIAVWQLVKPRPQEYKPVAPHIPIHRPQDRRAYSLGVLALIAGIIFGLIAFHKYNDQKEYERCLSSSPYYCGQRPNPTPSALLSVALLMGGLGNFVLLVRRDVEVTPLAFHPTTYTIQPKVGSPFSPVASQNLVHGLLETCPNLTFQIEARQGTTTWQVVDALSQYNGDHLIRTIKTHMPDVMVQLQPPVTASQLTQPIYRQFAVFHLLNEYIAPMPSLEMLKTDDPLIPITRRMDFVNEDLDESITYALICLTSTVDAVEAGRQRLQHEKVLYLSTHAMVQGVIPLDDNFVAPKRLQPHYHCFLVMSAQSRDADRLPELFSITADITRFGVVSYNQLGENWRSKSFTVQTPEQDMGASLWWFFSVWVQKEEDWRETLMILTPPEIAGLWHLPDERFSAVSIDWLKTREVRLTRNLQEVKQGIPLGVNRYSGEERPVYLPDEDRTTHTAIIGKNGTGKSSLMHTMIHADIAAGKGVCVIDPHGSLVQGILQASIPEAREQDVVVLDLSTTVDGKFYPPPLNPLAKPAGVEGQSAAGMIISILSENYADFAEKQMAYLLNNTLLALYYEPDASLLNVVDFLEDGNYRANVLSKLKNPVVKRAWKRFEEKTDRDKENMVFPLIRRLDSFITNNHLLAMTCHPQPLDLRALVASNKIILVSLGANQARIPPIERRILGSMLVSQIQMAAMDNAIQHPPFMLYIDEAQNFTTTKLPEMLAEVRKHGLGLVLANQYFRQLAGDTLDALEGNVGTLIAFEVGEPDAQTLAAYLKPALKKEDLIAFGKYRAAVSLRYQGKRQEAFSLETLPPPHQHLSPATAKNREIQLRRLSIQQYTPMAYDRVEAALNKRYDPDRQDLPHTPETGTTNGKADEFIEPRKKKKQTG